MMRQHRQGSLQPPPSSLEEQVVGGEVVTADLKAFRRKRGEEAERVAAGKGFEEPNKVRVTTFDGETAL